MLPNPLPPRRSLPVVASLPAMGSNATQAVEQPSRRPRHTHPATTASRLSSNRNTPITRYTATAQVQPQTNGMRDSDHNRDDTEAQADRFLEELAVERQQRGI